MAIYVFSLLSGYSLGGMDYSQGARYKYLNKLSVPVKYIYTNIPTNYSLHQYSQAGIQPKDVISIHFYMSGITCLETNEITEKNYYSNGQLIAREYYSNHLLYTDYFATNTPNSQLVRRSFKDYNGLSAFDILFDANNEEMYLFPSGQLLTKQEFLCEFIKKLNLNESDIALVDRGGHSEFAQPLFAHKNKARIITFIHANHYAEKGEASGFLYFNYEYYYWFSHSQMIHTMIVSTELQKKELAQKLQEHGCYVPNIEVIPANGLNELLYTSTSIQRKPYSLITASRLDQGKKIDWIIRCVAIAHKHIPDLTLDIFGTGSSQELQRLTTLVKDLHAESFIRFMGHCDMHLRYLNYEAYISASLSETLGLTLMEAAGSGTALLGLDVKYGNKIFIQNNFNGYTTPFDFTKINDVYYINELICKMADNIIKLFNSPSELKRFQSNSYQISSQYINTIIEKQWIDFFETLLK